MGLRDDFGERIVVAVGGVVLDRDRRILLVKHVEAKRGGFWFGKWICPGGKLEAGETLVEWVRREVRGRLILRWRPRAELSFWIES